MNKSGSFQTRGDNGKFSTTKRAASQTELSRMAIQREAIAASTEHRSWLDDNGYEGVSADELFASAR